MKHTQTYRNQHDEIRRAGQALTEALATGDTAAIRKSLSHLSGVIEAHLSLEETSFYPALLKYADPEIRRIAKVYQESMAKLAAAYTAFRTRWLHLRAIDEDRSGFERELHEVWGALDRRIDLENKTLYSMVDGLANIAV